MGERLVLLLVLLCPTAAAGQETQPLAWSQGQSVIGHISDGLVAANLAGDAWTAWRSEDHAGRWQWACRTGLGFGVNELLKRAIKRERPDGSDRKSFPSMHTMAATMSAGWKLQIGGAVAIGAGYGRMAAGKHFVTDVLAGGGLGLIARTLCR